MVFDHDPQGNLLEASWRRCWGAIGAAGSGDALRDRLLAAYREPQRKYHTVQHLRECLELFERTRSGANRQADVEMALWFHDAIYDVKGKDNEARSAAWAVAELGKAGVTVAHISHVEQLVMATRHDAEPVGCDEQLLVDIDLAILGASRTRFLEYEEQVRAEYGWVPGFVFRSKRREILQAFLARSPLYKTTVVREEREGQAKSNLAYSIAALGG